MLTDNTQITVRRDSEKLLLDVMSYAVYCTLSCPVFTNELDWPEFPVKVDQ